MRRYYNAFPYKIIKLFRRIGSFIPMFMIMFIVKNMIMFMAGIEI